MDCSACSVHEAGQSLDRCAWQAFMLGSWSQLGTPFLSTRVYVNMANKGRTILGDSVQALIDEEDEVAQQWLYACGAMCTSLQENST